MKKISTLFTAALLALAAQAQEGVTYQVKTLTFEDTDYPKDAPNYLGETTWSSLIDSPQYGGTLLYGENHGDTSKTSTDVNYKWYDKGNTNLYSELPTNWGTQMYWGGGHAISNYWNGNLSDGDYTHQLSVYVADETGSGQSGHGHNGSNNFCVHYGYKDNSGYSASNLPAIEFKDAQNHMIEGVYINNTTYFVNCITNGNGLTSALGTGDYVKIQATGYKADGTLSAIRTFDLASDTSFVKSWSHWDLRKLGYVNRVEFNVIGTSDNGYGFSQPAYFCYDDVSVRMPLASSTTTDTTTSSQLAANSSAKKLRAYNDDFDYFTTLQGDVPEGASIVFDGDNALKAGETETYTIKGMPENTVIKSIKADISLGETTYSDMEVEAYLGGTKIAFVNIAGQLSSVKSQLVDPKYPQQSELIYDMTMLDAAKTPGSGDLVFKLSSINGVNEYEAQGVCYYITYEIIDPTGITNANAESNTEEVIRFTTDGKRISAPQKGINIIRMSDGTTRKVVVE